MPHIIIGGRRLHYVEHGTGFPVLFGTSFLWDAAMWMPQVERLAGRFRCIVPELWGHGQSEAVPEVPYSISKLTADMRALADTLGLDQLGVVGLSVGGMWATQMALESPRRVKALVLMDTFVGPEPIATQTRYFGMLDTLERLGAMPAALAEQVLPLFFAPETMTSNPALVERFRQLLLGVRNDRVASVVALGRAIFSRPSLFERLGDIHCPALVAVGRQDRSRPVHEAEEMAKAIPGARLEVIEHAGHISNLEQPEHVLALLNQFLSSAL